MADQSHLNKDTYLTLIQGVITRMANNAFMIKGWALTLTAALLAIYVSLNSSTNEYTWAIGLVSIVCVLSFWYLDAYFYYNEEKYRSLYNDVRVKDSFTPEESYNLNASICKLPEYDDEKYPVLLAVKKKAVFPIYALQLLIIVMLMLLTICKN